MSEFTHVHDDSADSLNTHAQYRLGGKVQTRNFRLVRTKGTDTKFSFIDRRNLAEIQFDHVRIGCRIGRGDTVQFYVGEIDEDKKLKHIGLTRVGDYYQHDLDSEILDELEYLEEHGSLRPPNYIVDTTVSDDE